MKAIHRERIKQAQVTFQALHPNLFDLEKPVPFAIGFHDELRALYPQVPKVILKGLLWWLTRRKLYLQACVTGANRYRLNGVSGTVSAGQAAHARKLHAEQKRKSRARQNQAQNTGAAHP